MEKLTAIKLLGGTPKKAAQAMGITPQAISMWPDVLTPNRADRVRGVLSRISEDAKKEAKAHAKRAKAATNSVAAGVA